MIALQAQVDTQSRFLTKRISPKEKGE